MQVWERLDKQLRESLLDFASKVCWVTLTVFQSPRTEVRRWRSPRCCDSFKFLRLNPFKAQNSVKSILKIIHELTGQEIIWIKATFYIQFFFFNSPKQTHQKWLHYKQGKVEFTSSCVCLSKEPFMRPMSRLFLLNQVIRLTKNDSGFPITVVVGSRH